jgi:hypothetical protein
MMVQLTGNTEKARRAARPSEAILVGNGRIAEELLKVLKASGRAAKKYSDGSE